MSENKKRWIDEMEDAWQEACSGGVLADGTVIPPGVAAIGPEMLNVLRQNQPNVIGISNFVKRQTADSEFTHFDGTWEQLEDCLEGLWRSDDIIEWKDGYREGVRLISVNPSRFYTHTDFEMFEGMKLSAEYRKVTGREHEPPKVITKIEEPKQRCNYVDIVLYRWDVLEEDGDRTDKNAMWEVISINGRMTKEDPPMDPMTIVRNWKHLPGGTEMKGKTPEEVLEMLCQSIMYKNGIKR